MSDTSAVAAYPGGEQIAIPTTPVPVGPRTSTAHSAPRERKAVGVEQSFLTRQRVYSQHKEEHIRQLAKATAPTFAPELTSHPAELLVKSPRHSCRLSETEADLFRRLSQTDAAERDAHRAALAEEAVKQLPFKPAPLSPVSAKLAPHGPGLDELYTDTRRVKALAEAQVKYGQPRFEPDTRSSRQSRRKLLHAEQSAVPRVPGAVQPSERLHRLLKDKEERLEQIRCALAADEAKVCTFKPVISKAPPAAPTSPEERPAVKGMDTFVALQEAARKRRAEKEAAAQAAIAEVEGRVVAVPPAVVATWTPFSLADPARLKPAEERLKRVQQEVEQERTAECTFKPVLLTKLAATEGVAAAAAALRPKSAPTKKGAKPSESSPSALAAAEAGPGESVKFVRNVGIDIT
jgi:hypothetical protein